MDITQAQAVMDMASAQIKSEANETWSPAHQYIYAKGFIDAYDQQSALIKRLANAIESVSSYNDGCGCCMCESVMDNKEVQEAISAIPKEYPSEGRGE